MNNESCDKSYTGCRKILLNQKATQIILLSKENKIKLKPVQAV